MRSFSTDFIQDFPKGFEGRLMSDWTEVKARPYLISVPELMIHLRMNFSIFLLFFFSRDIEFSCLVLLLVLRVSFHCLLRQLSVSSFYLTWIWIYSSVGSPWSLFPDAIKASPFAMIFKDAWCSRKLGELAPCKLQLTSSKCSAIQSLGTIAHHHGNSPVGRKT